jgi:hypothetical protein
LLGRRPDAFFHPQFRAENFVFLIGAEKVGFAAIARPQAGYLHVIPRLIAWPATWLDPPLQPALFVGGWLVVALRSFTRACHPATPVPLDRLAAGVAIVAGAALLGLAGWMLATEEKDSPGAGTPAA